MIEMALAKRAADILAALKAADGAWLNRVQLAKATGKQTLSPNDRRWLDELERAGEIEALQQKAANPKGFEWVYRIKQG